MSVSNIEMDDKGANMFVLYEKQISDGNHLMLKVGEMDSTKIKGVNKLHRKVKKDIQFLSESLQKNTIKKEHLTCTNLHFYKSLVDEILNHSEVEAVLETFSYNLEECKERLTVDIVSEKGQQWTKVIARNQAALQHIFKDGDGYGRRSIVDQALAYISAAEQNLHLFKPPKEASLGVIAHLLKVCKGLRIMDCPGFVQVVFLFVNGVPEKLKLYLERRGIVVKGEMTRHNSKGSDSEDGSSSSESDSDSEIDALSPSVRLLANVYPQERTASRINLCVTTMMAFVSALTNGGCDKSFTVPILNELAERERICPVKPFLVNLFNGKELISCTSAVEDFKTILDTIGGVEERRRAENLLSQIQIVPDEPFPALKPTGKIKKRSLLIFGTGHKLGAITVSANKGFHNAALQKGVNFAAIIHESRALSERKELPGDADE